MSAADWEGLRRPARAGVEGASRRGMAGFAASAKTGLSPWRGLVPTAGRQANKEQVVKGHRALLTAWRLLVRKHVLAVTVLAQRDDGLHTLQL